MSIAINERQFYATDRATTTLPGTIHAAHDLLEILTVRVISSTQTAVARDLGVSVQYLGDVLHGRRGISEAMAERLGYRRVVVFVGDR